MQAYLVGGAVRDILLGHDPKDRDVVVVGSTPKQMLEKGYRQVGKDFPIFISGLDDAEYSLARRSRKNGITDFSPEVTLVEDLAKRDLTINAMAVPLHLIGRKDRIIDPFFGHDDLLNKVLRMVSMEAFREDPIRVLRVARFAARYPDFRIDPQTMHVMRTMALMGELDNLVPERVWKELSRGLMEVKPSRMLQVLRDCGALKIILPEVDALYGVPQPEQHHPEVDTGIHIEQVLDYAASQNFDDPGRGAYYNITGLITAVHADAKPILLWDDPENRNPVSSYVYIQGSSLSLWGLRGKPEIVAIVKDPKSWNCTDALESGKYSTIFVFNGGKDTLACSTPMFPETFRAELHEVRSVLESFFRSKPMTELTPDQQAVVGVRVDSSACHIPLLVTKKDAVVRYQIDRAK